MPSYAIIHTLSFFTFSGKAFRYFQTKKKQFRELPCPFMKYTMTKRHMESPVACFHYKIKKVRPFIVIPVIPQGYFHAAEQFPRSFPTALPRPRGGGRHRASGAVPSTHGSGRMRGTRKNAEERGGNAANASGEQLRKTRRPGKGGKKREPVERRTHRITPRETGVDNAPDAGRTKALPVPISRRRKQKQCRARPRPRKPPLPGRHKKSAPSAEHLQKGRFRLMMQRTPQRTPGP